MTLLQVGFLGAPGVDLAPILGHFGIYVEMIFVCISYRSTCAYVFETLTLAFRLVPSVLSDMFL